MSGAILLQRGQTFAANAMTPQPVVKLWIKPVNKTCHDIHADERT